jgi:hypothetical protein
MAAWRCFDAWGSPAARQLGDHLVGNAANIAGFVAMPYADDAMV